MPPTANKKMDSPSVPHLQPSSMDSPASMTSGEVESSASHLHLEGSTLLTTPGHMNSVDALHWISSANPTHQQHITNSFPSLIPTTMGFPFAQQAATVHLQLTHPASTATHPLHGLPMGAVLAYLNIIHSSQLPPAPETVPAGSQGMTTLPAFSADISAHDHPLHPPPPFQHHHPPVTMTLSESLSPLKPFAFHHHRAGMSSFNAAAFVDTLEEVDIASIAPKDMRCPHCWLPFGTTAEEQNPSILAYMDDEEREITWRMMASYEMPFCQNRPNNDPVKTPCGHIFGRQCLIESLEETNRMCPMCRQRLGRITGVPTRTVVPLETDDFLDLIPVGLL